MAGLIPFNKKSSNELSPSFDPFQHMLDDFFSDAWMPHRSLMADTFKIDVEDLGNEYLIEAELPGIKKEDIMLNMDDHRLTISVQIDEKTEEKKKHYIHRERCVRSMSRNVYLADGLSEGVSAKLSDGVLCVKVPKAKDSEKGKSIKIE